MTVWVDAQLSPQIARWLTEHGTEAFAVRDLLLRDSTDAEIFQAAKRAGAIVLTKDGDLSRLLDVHGPPPQVVWLTCGNTFNAALRRILEGRWSDVAALLTAVEALVEIA